MTNKYECGVFCFHPRCLQKFGTIGSFVFFFSFANVANQSMFAYISTQITSLERQFGFSSAQSGLIVSCNDFGFLVSALFIGYIASRVHVPKSLSLVTALIGVASLMAAVPYFISRSDMEVESWNRLSQLPDVQTIEMFRKMQHMPVSMDTNSNNGTRDPSRLPYRPVTPGSAADVADQNGIDNKVANVTELPTPIATQSIAAMTSQPPYNPVLPFFNKLISALGAEAESVLNQTGFTEGDTPNMNLVKRMIKIIVANQTLLHMLPPEGQKRAMMFARLSKRSAPYVDEDSVSDVGGLSPVELLMVMTPLCTRRQKRPRDCEMVAKFLNKGFVNKHTGLAFGMLAAAMVLQGIGKSARMPMGLLYFDDNGSKMKTPLYLGISFTGLVIGAFLAFGVGVLASRLYFTLEDVDIHPLNPHWIGAWWLGFIIIAVVAFIAAIPLLCFPKRLRSRPKNLDYQESENNVRDEESRGLTESTRDYLASVKRCMTNPILVMMMMCGSLTILMVAGTMPFTPKYLETQFTLPAWKAIIFTGSVKVLTTLLGSNITGILVTKKKLSEMAILKWMIGVSVLLVLCAGIGMIFGCDTVKIVGFNSVVTFNDPIKQNSSACAAACHCEAVDYFPVCGSDGRNYFSACHAGCTGRESKTFTDCTCVGGASTASLGMCKNSCGMLGPYLAVSGLGAMFLTGVGLCLAVIGLRSVADKDRGMAVGLCTFFGTLLGWLPGPIVFGKLVDSVCMLRKTTCAQLHGGACAVYDANKFRIVFHSYLLVLSFLSTLVLIIATVKARSKKDWNSKATLFSNVCESNEGNTEAELKLVEKR